jgi:hypothetical protein
MPEAEESAVALADLPALIAAAPAGKLIRGTFTVYKTGEGGLHIAYLLDGQEETGHVPIPAGILRMATMASGGKGPLGMLFRGMG